MLYRKISHLKEHLVTVHRWSSVNASSSRFNFGLNVERRILPDDERKVKRRVYRKRICPFIHCGKVIVRMENHLTGPSHKLTGDLYHKKLKDAKFADSTFENTAPLLTKPNNDKQAIIEAADTDRGYRDVEM